MCTSIPLVGDDKLTESYKKGLKVRDEFRDGFKNPETRNIICTQISGLGFKEEDTVVTGEFTDGKFGFDFKVNIYCGDKAYYFCTKITHFPSLFNGRDERGSLETIVKASDTKWLDDNYIVEIDKIKSSSITFNYHKHMINDMHTHSEFYANDSRKNCCVSSEHYYPQEEVNIPLFRLYIDNIVGLLIEHQTEVKYSPTS